MTGAMMITGGTGHVNDHRVVEHRAVPFRNAGEFLRHFCHLFQVEFLDFHARLVTGPAVGCLVFLQVAQGVHGIRELELRILHAQGIRTEGDYVRQTCDQSGGGDFKVRFDPRGRGASIEAVRSFGGVLLYPVREGGFLCLDLSQ